MANQMESAEISGRIISLPRRGDPRVIMRQTQGEILRFCDTLEEIADSLPGSIGSPKCQLAAEKIEPLIGSAHEFEESTIFPMAHRELMKLGASPDCIDRLKAEHLEDQSFASELATILRSGVDQSVIHAEMLGYMLRGFFESVRRHTAFERDYLMTLFDYR